MIKIWDTQTGQLLRNLVCFMQSRNCIQTHIDQGGHDNWVRALVFHPSGKFLLSASDDHTIRVWELATGRCVKTVQAHSHFVACMAWGRQATSGSTENGATTNGSAALEPEKIINVVATGSVDQTIKIWLP